MAYALVRDAHWRRLGARFSKVPYFPERGVVALDRSGLYRRLAETILGLDLPWPAGDCTIISLRVSSGVVIPLVYDAF